MREIDPLARLRAFVDGYPTQGAAAKQLKISGAYLSDLLNGRREFSAVILERLELRRIVVSANGGRS